jgi:hypothetical protein
MAMVILSWLATGDPAQRGLSTAAYPSVQGKNAGKLGILPHLPAKTEAFAQNSGNIVFMNWKYWSGRRDSNSRPTVPKTVALPGCATPRLTLS